MKNRLRTGIVIAFAAAGEDLVAELLVRKESGDRTQGDTRQKTASLHKKLLDSIYACNIYKNFAKNKYIRVKKGPI